MARKATLEIFSIFSPLTILPSIPDPVYPVYVDTNIMDGRRIVFARGTGENGFLPLPDAIPAGVTADLIYLCSPNNPTGAVYDAGQLKVWVDYARAHDSIILFDAAYEAFISDPALPRSIFAGRRRAGMRHRVLLAFEDGGLHRRSLRVYCGAGRTDPR